MGNCFVLDTRFVRSLRICCVFHPLNTSLLVTELSFALAQLCHIAQIYHYLMCEVAFSVHIPFPDLVSTFFAAYNIPRVFTAYMSETRGI